MNQMQFSGMGPSLVIILCQLKQFKKWREETEIKMNK